MKKTIFAFLLIVSLLMSLPIPVFAAAEERGIAFTEDPYKPDQAYNTTPNTFEAWVYFPANMPASQRGGVIIGNYGGSTASINFEIHQNGHPRLYWVNSAGQAVDYIFTSVNVYTGKWTHVALVRENEAGKLHCYINGELAQTLTKGQTENVIPPSPYVVGGDQRGGNAQYFKGRIESVVVYSNSRSAEEIQDAMYFIDTDDEHLLAAYDFTDKPEDENFIEDISGNGFDAQRVLYWMDTKKEVTDYAYSFAVIGDTQVITEKHPDKLACIYDYIVDHVDDKNIQFVMGLGDITEKTTQTEWDIALENIHKLDDLVPYSVVRGNHDAAAHFKNAFPYEEYKDIIGGSYQNDMLNTWQELVVGDIKYLIMTLDFGPSNAVLDWANDVIEAHPEHNVIITTHAYLFRDGTTLDAGDVCPPATHGGYNNGDHMWDKLISKHENIVLVLSGHDPCDNVVMTQTEGDHGNIVTQMLIDPQGVDAALGATGLVAMLYFSEDGSHVTVEYYSTVREQFFISTNQFEFDLAVVGKQEPAPDQPNTDDPGTDQPSDTPDDEQNPDNNPTTDVQPAPQNNTLPTVLGIIAGVELIVIVVLVILLSKKKK